MCALLFAPICNNLIKEYSYTVSDYMVKRKGIQDLINKIFGKGPM